MATQGSKGSNSLLDELPVDRLKDEAINLGKTLAKRGAAKLGERLAGAPGKLGDLTDAVPGPTDMVKAVGKAASPLGPVKGAASKVKDALPGTGSDDDDADGGASQNAVGDDTDLKVTNIVESIDVPVSREIAYELWTQFEEFPSFMKKVEAVNQKDPELLTWKAQIFWSHRTWTAKIIDQVPPERIVWKSEADKGRVDGAVTFHELAPDLTRVLVSLEYFPQGLFERTGNLWRAQGRRVRLELKHFRRHVANHALINQDDVEGWSGEIHDGKVKSRRRSSSAQKSTQKSAQKSAQKKSTSSNGSAAKKSTSSNGSTAKKAASSNGSTAKKASGSTAKKSTSGSSTARKSTSNGSTAKKTTSKRPAAKKSTSNRRTAKKTTSGGSTSRSRPAKKTASARTSKRTAAASKRSSTTSKRTSRTTRSKS